MKVFSPNITSFWHLALLVMQICSNYIQILLYARLKVLYNRGGETEAETKGLHS